MMIKFWKSYYSYLKSKDFPEKGLRHTLNSTLKEGLQKGREELEQVTHHGSVLILIRQWATSLRDSGMVLFKGAKFWNNEGNTIHEVSALLLVVRGSQGLILESHDPGSRQGQKSRVQTTVASLEMRSSWVRRGRSVRYQDVHSHQVRTRNRRQGSRPGSLTGDLEWVSVAARDPNVGNHQTEATNQETGVCTGPGSGARSKGSELVPKN